MQEQLMGTKMPKTIEEQLMGMENCQKQLTKKHFMGTKNCPKQLKNNWWVQKIAQYNWKTIEGYKKLPKTIEQQLMGTKNIPKPLNYNWWVTKNNCKPLKKNW